MDYETCIMLLNVAVWCAIIAIIGETTRIRIKRNGGMTFIRVNSRCFSYCRTRKPF